VASKDPRYWRARWLAWTSLAILAAACSDTPPQPVTEARVRFVNLIADGLLQPVNVFLDGEPFGTRLPYGASSPFWRPPPHTANYAGVTSGEHEIVLQKSSDSATIALYSFTIAAGEDKTLYATGSGGLFARETVDDNTAPVPGTIRLRVVNLSFAAGTVDLFITSQTGDLATATPVITGITVAEPSAYFTVTPGTWRVRAVRTGVAPSARATNVVVNLNDQLWERGARTILIADITGGFGSASTGTVLLDQ
jgi:hypothetical protein